MVVHFGRSCVDGARAIVRAVFCFPEKKTNRTALSDPAQAIYAKLSEALEAAAKAEREKNILLQSLDEHSIVSIADSKGRIIEVNDGFCRISRYPREELLGKDHRIINSGEHPPAFWAQFWQTISSGRTWRGEICNRAKDGTLYWVDSMITPFRGIDGKIEKYVSIRYDITQRKNAERALMNYAHQMEDSRATAEAQALELEVRSWKLTESQLHAELASRAKSEFLANMSHEIRTPLTSILGFAELLEEEGPDCVEQRRQAVAAIKNSGKHLLAVINDILDLSKIEAGKMAVEQISTPLLEVLREVINLLAPRAAGKGLELRSVFTEPVPDRVLGDPTRLRQVLLNLVGNAVKFTENGKVTIIVGTLQREGRSRLIIDVDDTGPGMLPEQSERLFTAFDQADTTVTRKHGGTGLGLAISRRLAGLMGGTVQLVRTDIGKGTRFRLELPLNIAPGAATAMQLNDERELKPRPVAPPSLTGRILLAEDGLDNQRLIAHHLRKAGAAVDVADNGRIALSMLQQAAADGMPYQLLVTDMQMPEIDGYSLARTLRADGNEIPIVALTAHAMSEDRRKCLDAGCDDYASKPIDSAQLISICSHWLLCLRRNTATAS